VSASVLVSGFTAPADGVQGGTLEAAISNHMDWAKISWAESCPRLSLMAASKLVAALARQYCGAAEGQQLRNMAPRRIGWRQPAAALAGAVAATIVLLLADHALRDCTIADAANVSPVRTKTVSTNATDDFRSTVASSVDTSDMSAERAWLAIRDGEDIGVLRAFVAKFHGSFYAELALDRITRLLRFTSAFGVDTDAACQIAASYSLTDQDGKRTLRIWSLPSGRLMRSFFTSAPITGTVLLDGYVAASSDREVNLFDLQRGSIKQWIRIQPMAIPSSRPLVPSPDGKRLLLADSEAGERLLAESTGSDGRVFVGEELGRLSKTPPAPVRVLDVDSGEIRSVMSNLLRVSSEKLNCYGVNAERRSFLESSP
jgi:hypothetical protein